MYILLPTFSGLSELIIKTVLGVPIFSTITFIEIQQKIYTPAFLNIHYIRKIQLVA